jgi:mannose-6-phosphate isomerase-like protein (cupin superfamily)
MAAGETHGTGEVVDLGAGAGSGPLWGMASHDLNATLLAWPAGHAVAEHVNAELDVLVVVVEGSATVTIDDAPHELGAPAAILVPRGTRRAIRPGAGGARYLSVHRRRGPLQIAPLPTDG